MLRKRDAITMPADFVLPAVDESSPRYDGWRVTAVCFVVAMFCWGFGLYSHGIYLAQLQHLFGWSASLISGATTAYYLLTASLVVFVSDAIVQFGPRRIFLTGTCCLGSAVALLAFVAAPWQLYLVYLVMAVGSAAMHVGAITNVLSLWFDRQRGLAISLALNGASSGGIFVAPTLVIAIAATGFAAVMVGAATVMAAILIPAIAIGIDRPPIRTDPGFPSAPRIGVGFRLRATSLDASGGVAEPRVLECGGTVRPSADGPSRFPGAPDRLSRTDDRSKPRGIDGRRVDRHGDHRTTCARRVHFAARSSPRDRAVAGKPGGRAVCDDADGERCCPFCRLRDIRPVGRKLGLASRADHSARVRGNLVRHGGGIVDRHRPVHIRIRPRPARCRSRCDRRLHRRARALHDPAARRRGSDPDVAASAEADRLEIIVGLDDLAQTIFR